MVTIHAMQRREISLLQADAIHDGHDAIHRMRFVAFAAGYFGQRRNLPSPRATFLAMGEDNVAIDYARFHNNSSRLIALSFTTRAPVSSTPSPSSRFRCSAN